MAEDDHHVLPDTPTKLIKPERFARNWLTPRVRSCVLLLVVTALLAGCAGPPSPKAAEATTHCGVGSAAPMASPSGGEADFALYGFPRVAVSQRFTPGVEGSISNSGITLVMPADMYTEALDFELLVGEEKAWQPCVEGEVAVIAPYAYRVTEAATGKRISRFDKPVSVSISDPRIVEGATYWLTSADHPPGVQASSNRPEVSGTVLRVTNGGARAGWFVTVPQS